MLHPKLYIIDGDESSRDSISLLLVSEEISVELFDSAESFLQAASQSIEQVIEGEVADIPAMCIVTDLRLPGISGIQLLSELSTRDWPIPAIIATAYGSVSSVVRAMELGAETVLEKPLIPEKLLPAIQKALARSLVQRDAVQTRARLNNMSNSELSVLRGIVAGKKNLAIAADIQLGLRTVELRRSKIMKALGVRSTAELVRKIVEAQRSPPPLQGPHRPESFRKDALTRSAEEKLESEGKALNGG